MLFRVLVNVPDRPCTFVFLTWVSSGSPTQSGNVTEALTKNDANKTNEYLHNISRMSDYYTEASIMQTRAAF